VGLDARRSRPTDEGWGYDVSVQRDDVATSGFGQLEYQGRAGRYTLQAESFDGSARGRAIVSGALVAIGGRVFATPPLDAGFALVRVPGLPGVPVLRENLEVGRTDARGDLLMRDLLPFYANKVGLDESAVPPGFATDVPRRDVQVPRNAGALVVLDAAPVHAVTGRFVRDDGGAGSEAAGDRAWLDAPAGRIEAPLGRGGRFYLEDLGPGRHAVRVDGANGNWNCLVDIPRTQPAGIIDLGEIVCERSGDTPQ
jgi:outer membrane usher protein